MNEYLDFAIPPAFGKPITLRHLLRLIQLIGLFCCLGAAIAVWNAWLTWRGTHGGVTKVLSLIPALALAYLVWFSFAFHLLSMRLN